MTHRLPLVPDLSLRLKSTTHLNLVLEGGASADSVVDWLAGLQTPQRTPEALNRHHETLMRRRQGGWSIPEIAERTGEPIHSLRNLTRIAQYLSFCPFEFDGDTVSVDILNAANELGFSDALAGREVAEVFVTEGSRSPDRFWRLLKNSVAHGKVDFAFGGYMSFTARLAFGLLRKQPELKWGRRVEDFLWPIQFTRSLPNPEALSSSAIYRFERGEGGFFIQLWDNLVGGVHPTYRDLAHSLGLGCLWELRAPKVERIPLRLGSHGATKAGDP